MNIIYQLPFPDEICYKIVLYAFKSPYTDLHDEIFKRAVPTDIYQKLVEKGKIEIDAQGHIIKANIQSSLNNVELKNIQFDIRFLPRNLAAFSFTNYAWLSLTPPPRPITGITGDIKVLQELQNLTTFFLDCTDVFGDIQALQGLQHLTKFDLCMVGVKGDIQVLQELQNLTYFSIQSTGVTGDIQVLRWLQHLTTFNISYTGVFGDIQVLQSLPKLTQFSLVRTGVLGDIQVLQSLPKLTEFSLESTGVFGDKEAFQDHRKTHGLKKCRVCM